jgi:hypothetical protein
MTSMLLSLAVIAAFLLIGAGVHILVKRSADRRRGVLMLLAGIVTLINVILFATMPALPS